MKIYVMRHSTTNANEKGICQGRTQGRLSKSGVALVQQRAEELKNTKIDLIICSPLARTVQTAKIMNKYHNVTIQKEPLITEIDQGIFTGKTKHEIPQEQFALREEAKINGTHKELGVETYAQLWKRASEFVNQLKETRPAENILVITHNVTATFISHILANHQIDFTNRAELAMFKNAEIKSFEI